MSAYNFGGSGPTLTKLYQVTWQEAGVIKWSLILQEGAPYNISEGKKCPKFCAIFDNFRNLSTDISGTDRQIENRKST